MSLDFLERPGDTSSASIRVQVDRNMKAELYYLDPVLKAGLLRRLKGGGLRERVEAAASLASGDPAASAS
uniref:Uncharacterized protein n=1 Tax=Oryza brachyantha TaxID=4533 RepID=J3LCC7_ORYBR